MFYKKIDLYGIVFCYNAIQIFLYSAIFLPSVLVILGIESNAAKEEDMGIVPEPDFLLIQKMRMGDEKALNAFVTKYYAKILTYCRMHVDDQDYAQDLAQETFVRFFRSFRQYQHYGKAANYLYVVASNLCSDYYRRKKEWLFDTDTIRDAPDERCSDPDTRLMVRMALERLPKDIRETAVLYFVQEQKQKDIAAILGIGLPLVKYRIKRARKLLSEYLK